MRVDPSNCFVAFCFLSENDFVQWVFCPLLETFSDFQSQRTAQTFRKDVPSAQKLVFPTSLIPKYSPAVSTFFLSDNSAFCCLRCTISSFASRSPSWQYSRCFLQQTICWSNKANSPLSERTAEIISASFVIWTIFHCCFRGWLKKNMIVRASKVTFLPASSTPAPAPVKYRQLNLDLLGALESSCAFIICALPRYYGCGRKFFYRVQCWKMVRKEAKNARRHG